MYISLPARSDWEIQEALRLYSLMFWAIAVFATFYESKATRAVLSIEG